MKTLISGIEKEYKILKESQIDANDFELSYEKESCEKDFPPAAGRFCDILLIHRSAILAEHLGIYENKNF